MKDIVYVQKNIMLDAILLSVTIITATCAVPLTIIFNAPVFVVCLIITLLVLMITMFVLFIWYNSVGISFNGISLKTRKQRGIIFWRDVSDIKVKASYAKAIIVRYNFEMENCTICIYNTPYLLDTLLKYCIGDERLKAILQQCNKELEDKLGW